MEKQQRAFVSNGAHETRHRTPIKNKFLFVSGWLVCAGLLWNGHGYRTPWTYSDTIKPYNEKKDFDWDTTPALPYLKYEECYGGEFQCARLELPMDYWNGTTNDTIGLAVIRLPAGINVTDPRYGGPVLLNPGGPGGSGIGLVRSSGKEIARQVGAEDGKLFDIVSFDPRGVRSTTPPMKCFEDTCAANNWLVRRREDGIWDTSDSNIAHLWQLFKAYGESCSLLPEDGRGDIRQHMSTASVATDMVSLIEAHGEWREREAARLRGPGCAHRAKDKNAMHDGVPQPLRYIKGQEKLQYWGFSYGTYLGATFAAMYPDKVERLLIDGVVDAYDYRKAIWTDNLLDTERTVDQFYHHCARVGYPTCALANETGRTTKEGVKARVTNITSSLVNNPMPIIQRGRPEVITYNDVMRLLFGATYHPVEQYPFMAKMLEGIEKSNATFIADYLLSQQCTAKVWPGNSDDGESDGIPSKTNLWYISGDPTMGIACSDGDDQSWVDQSFFEEHVKNVTRLSPFAGPLWAEIRLTCAHYHVRPFHRFTAPWQAKTRHPLLLIGNTADPVTPLRCAQKMAQGFDGAVVLTQDSPGHCSNAAASKCTNKYIKRYFQTGELPPANTTCEVDELPFGPSPGEEVEAVNDETVALKADMATVQAALFNSAGGFLRPGSMGGSDLTGYR